MGGWGLSIYTIVDRIADMQDMFENNEGITYALIHIIIGILFIGVIWVTFGVVVDEFNLLSNSLVETGDMWGSKTQLSILDLNYIWDKVLWIFILASLIYGVVTAIRRERRGIDG